MQHAQALPPAKVMLLEIGAGGNEEGAVLRKLVQRRVRPRRLMECAGRAQRRRRFGSGGADSF